MFSRDTFITTTIQKILKDRFGGLIIQIITQKSNIIVTCQTCFSNSNFFNSNNCSQDFLKLKKHTLALSVFSLNARVRRYTKPP